MSGEKFKGDESGAFRWLLFPDARRQCRVCGKEPLKIADVGEHRKLWPSQKTEFLCKVCMSEKVAKAVRENVERMMQR